MTLNPGDLLFVGWDSDNDDIAFIATTDIPEGEVIYFTDDEWDGTAFLGSEQLIEWTVPPGGLTAGEVVTIDMDPVADTINFDVGGDIDYVKGGFNIAGRNEMFWAFQGDRVGDTVTPTNFISVIANEATGTIRQTPLLDGTGLTSDNGAIIIDGDEDYMEWTGSDTLPDPATQQELIDSILDTSTWITADGTGNNNPNPGGGGFVVDPPVIVVCFCSGTQIATPDGQKRVEDLRVGQLISLQCGGTAPIRWIGKRPVAQAERARNPKLHPVRITAGSLGQGLPMRDLLVSRQHRLLVSSRIVERMFGARDVLVPAIALTRMPGIFIDTAAQDVVYHHILCDRHEVALAEGAPAETLYLGHEAIRALTPAGRQEIAALFPDIDAAESAFPNGRLFPCKKRQKRLIQRHERNNKPLLELLDRPVGPH